MRSVQELIEFNNNNAARAMPKRRLQIVGPQEQFTKKLTVAHTDQTDLIQTLKSSMTSETAAAAKAHGRRRAGLQGINIALMENEIDMIIGPGDCSICAVAALVGYPTAMVPLGRLEGPGGMGQPQGLMIVGGNRGEGKMLEFMKLWERVIGPWKIPPLLQTE